MDSHKVILVGEQYVGKTAIFVRLQKNLFNELESQATVQASFATKVVPLYEGSDEYIKLQLWDTAGAE